MARELFANNAQTTLNGAITAGATSLVVANAAAFPVASAGVSQFRVVIDSELFLVTATSGTTWTVVGGQEGTTQAAHANGATVAHTITAGGIAGAVPPPMPMPAVGEYWTPSSNSGVTNNWSLSQGYMLFQPLPVYSPMTIDSLSVQINTLGTAGALIRVGLYASDAYGRPGALIVDAGTVAADGTTGTKTLPVSATLGTGLHFLVAVGQGAPTTQPKVLAAALFQQPTTLLVYQATTQNCVIGQNNVSGALPATVSGITGNQYQSIPLVIIHRSA